MQLNLNRLRYKEVRDRSWNRGAAIRGTTSLYMNEISFSSPMLIVGTYSNYTVFEKDTMFRVTFEYIEDVTEAKMVVLLYRFKEPILYIDREYEEYDLVKMNIAILKHFAKIKIVDNLHEKFTYKSYGEITDEFLKYAEKQEQSSRE